MKQIIDVSNELGVESVIMGMPHRYVILVMGMPHMYVIVMMGMPLRYFVMGTMGEAVNIESSKSVYSI